jgi:hypothetical protein
MKDAVITLLPLWKFQLKQRLDFKAKRPIGENPYPAIACAVPLSMVEFW